MKGDLKRGKVAAVVRTVDVVVRRYDANDAKPRSREDREPLLTRRSLSLVSQEFEYSNY